MTKGLVMGALNIDLIFECKELPQPGKTIMAQSNVQSLGGKGLNQALFLSKMGINVNILGRVGDDYNGQMLLQKAEKFVDNSNYISVSNSKYSGIASINIDASGNKQIVVEPGANYDLTIKDIKEAENIFKDSDFLLCQLEIPLVCVEFALQIAKEKGKKTFLNANPGRKLTKKILESADYLIINELDLSKITNREIKDKKSFIDAIKFLETNGSKNVIVIAGLNKVLWLEKNNIIEKKINFMIDKENTFTSEDKLVSLLTKYIMVRNDISFAVDEINKKGNNKKNE